MGTCCFVGTKVIFKPGIDPWMKTKYQNFKTNEQDTTVHFLRDDLAIIQLWKECFIKTKQKNPKNLHYYQQLKRQDLHKYLARHLVHSLTLPHLTLYKGKLTFFSNHNRSANI